MRGFGLLNILVYDLLSIFEFRYLLLDRIVHKLQVILIVQALLIVKIDIFEFSQ